jgi:repressor LexA
MTMTKTDQTYNAIKGFIDAMGYPPTVRQLGAVLGLSSTDSVRERLLALEREGRIERVPGSPRAIILKESA